MRQERKTAKPPHGKLNVNVEGNGQQTHCTPIKMVSLTLSGQSMLHGFYVSTRSSLSGIREETVRERERERKTATNCMNV